MDIWSRREVIVTALTVGFSQAILPVAASVITTDTQGLVVGEVKIPVGDSEIPAYQARPEGLGPFPLVLVVQEIFGVHEHIRDVCRRLAKRGYYAIAPELFARQGDVTKLKDINEIQAIVRQVPDAQVMTDLDATVAYAVKTGTANGDRLAVTGFCWGGRIVWLYSAYNPRVRAGVAWYGRLVGEATPLQPKYPLEVVPALRIPVLGLYGGDDKGIPVSDVEQMQKAIKAANNPSEIVVYPEAPHGFHADYRPSYREKPAQDGFQRLIVWFQKYGV
ncbi:dienelactone hydrolase family protein [Candidatus Cyanaurora vandensis]|uniref:dienelactone hydrolase family protein n=1 Tax=Candidatus Cyanaurora vandensis TaxID=2714958 RepID=UPI00257C4527|nr:dienelactone hydrolase family protein [Candidatus Cyanaurora vandensis]